MTNRTERQPSRRAIILHRDDDVATALEDIATGDGAAVTDDTGARFIVRAIDAIPLGHKIAVRDVAAGHPIRKYGEVIGIARDSITAGALVHVHNVRSARLGGA